MINVSTITINSYAVSSPNVATGKPDERKLVPVDDATDEDGKLRVQLWGRNIFNEYYWNSTFQADTAWRMAGRPATYGISVGWRL